MYNMGERLSMLCLFWNKGRGAFDGYYNITISFSGIRTDTTAAYLTVRNAISARPCGPSFYARL